MTTNAPNSPLFPGSSSKATPSRVAATFAAYTKAVVVILFWAIVGAAAVGASYVAIRAIYWAVQIAVQPLH